jgi:hypothetical protein
MKARAEHQVPLADEVVVLLQSLPRDPTGKDLHLFPGKRVKTLSNMAMIQ